MPDVLLVDDNAINRFFNFELLTSKGFTIDNARNGLEAVELLKKAEYKIVLLDIEMPVMSGIETIRYIREKMDKPVRDMTVIAVTIHEEYIFEKSFREMGFTDALIKPYKPEALIKLVNKYIHQYKTKMYEK